MIQSDVYYKKISLPEWYLNVNSQKFLNDDSCFIADIQHYWKKLQEDDAHLDFYTKRNAQHFPMAECIAIDKKFDNANQYFEYGVGVETTQKNANLIIPACDWLVFPCVGPVNTSLPKTWKEFFYQFLNRSDWILRFDYNIEIYSPGNRLRSIRIPSS